MNIEDFKNQIAVLDNDHLNDYIVGFLEDMKNNYTIFTYKQNITKLRNMVKRNVANENKRNFILKKLVLKNEEKNRCVELGAIHLSEDKKNKKPVTEPEKIVDKAIGFLSSKSYLKRVVGLCLITGRRPIEILKTGQFFKYSNRLESIKFAENHDPKLVKSLDEIRNDIELLELWDKPFVLFAGQAKQNRESQTNLQATQPYPIPLLTDNIDLVLDSLAYIRKVKTFEDIVPTDRYTVNDIIAKSTANSLIKTAKTYLGDYTPKDLRSIYAVMTQNKYHKNQRLDETSWYEMILGHSKGSGSNINYRKFYIPE